MADNFTEMTPAAFPQGGQLVNIDGRDFIADLTSAKVSFCSMKPDTDENKKNLFRAMNNPDMRIGDCINMDITIVDLYCEVVQCTNRETGEVSECPRIVLIDKDGKSYQSVSLGIYSAVSKLIQIFGVPTWKEGIIVTVKQVSRGERKMLTLDMK